MPHKNCKIQQLHTLSYLLSLMSRPNHSQLRLSQQPKKWLVSWFRVLFVPPRRCTHMYCLFYGLIFFANESICRITHIFPLPYSGGPRLDRLHSTLLSRRDGVSSLKRCLAIWRYSVQAVSSFNSPQSSRRYLSSPKNFLRSFFSDNFALDLGKEILSSAAKWHS